MPYTETNILSIIFRSISFITRVVLIIELILCSYFNTRIKNVYILKHASLQYVHHMTKTILTTVVGSIMVVGVLTCGVLLHYGHLPPITKTMQARRTRHAGHCWRSKDELISDVLLWTPAYGQAKAGWPARTYIQKLCEDTGCSPEDLPEAMNDREKWGERVRDIRASGTTWWWWSVNLCFMISSWAITPWKQPKTFVVQKVKAQLITVQ